MNAWDFIEDIVLLIGTSPSSLGSLNINRIQGAAPLPTIQGRYVCTFLSLSSDLVEYGPVHPESVASRVDLDAEGRSASSLNVVWGFSHGERTQWRILIAGAR